MFFVTTLARRLFTAVKAAGDPVAAHQRLWHHLAWPLLNLVVARMIRLVRRFDRLVLKYERGQLPTPRAQRSRVASPRQPTPPEMRLPARFGWLQKIVPPAHMGAGYLSALLHDPNGEARALVEAAPQAGRILRPLCHILGLTPPDWLALPKRPRKPRPKPEPKPRRPRQTPERGFTRAQINRMTAAQLTAHYGRLPPHANLPIPNLNYIRRKIAAG